MKTQTTISIDLDLAERINRFAKAHDISKSFAPYPIFRPRTAKFKVDPEPLLCLT